MRRNQPIIITGYIIALYIRQLIIDMSSQSAKSWIITQSYVENVRILKRNRISVIMQYEVLVNKRMAAY